MCNCISISINHIWLRFTLVWMPFRLRYAEIYWCISMYTKYMEHFNMRSCSLLLCWLVLNLGTRVLVSFFVRPIKRIMFFGPWTSVWTIIYFSDGAHTKSTDPQDKVSQAYSHIAETNEMCPLDKKRNVWVLFFCVAFVV